MWSKLLHPFSSRRFIVSGFTLSVLIHLELNFVQGEKLGSICVLHVDFKVRPTSLLRTLSFYQYVFLASFQILGVHACVDLCVCLLCDSVNQFL